MKKLFYGIAVEQFLLYLLKTPCYARGSKELLAMDKKKTPVVQ